MNATKLALNTSQKIFGNAHNKNGKANAFRHAYWNYLICEKTIKFTKNAQKSTFWTQKVVDYYEKVTKNNILDAQMDFHNNELGRNVFLTHFNKESFNSVEFLKKMAQKGQKITKIEDIKNFQNRMVYISD